MNIPPEPTIIRVRDFWKHMHSFCFRYKICRPLNFEQWHAMLACMRLEPKYIIADDIESSYWREYCIGHRIPYLVKSNKPHENPTEMDRKEAKLTKHLDAAWGQLWWNIASEFSPWLIYDALNGKI